MPPHTPITVVLAHFDDLFARGLRELIESDPSLAIVAADVEHRRIGVVLRAHRPDVAILDIGALGKLAEVRELSDSHPGTRLILLCNDPAPAECAQLLAFGASACLGTGHPVARCDQRDPPRLAGAPGDPAGHGRPRWRSGCGRAPADQARGRSAAAAPAGSLERSDRARPAGGRRDGPHPRAQHLPQARRFLPPRARARNIR